MKITKIDTKADGSVSVDKYEVNKNDFEVISRFWQASDNATFIRDWTVDEYINHNPNTNKILPLRVNETVIDVVAHTVELRKIFATKDGKKISMFMKTVTYPEDSK